LKALLKSALRAVGGERFDAYMARRIERHNRRVMADLGVPEATEAFLKREGYVVHDGPFKEMEYIPDALGSALLPKLVGSYERELHGTLEKILTTTFETVVDVGCAEGYYAVGLAMHLPGSPKVYAYDINPEAQAACRELAAKNSVAAQVIIEGRCSPEELQKTLRGSSLVVCDCEGYELDLLDPASAPALAGAWILVELHDQFRPGLTPELTERFRKTHRITLIDSEDRDPADYPVVGFLSPEQQKVAVSEFRQTKQQWAYMEPLTGSLPG
jgi:hypothetical protein